MTAHTSHTSIAILGMGAIGTLMAFHWQPYRLFYISRHNKFCHPELIDLQSKKHVIHLPPWQQQPLDWLVVTTKAADTLAALKPLENNLKHIKRLVLLQNGMGQQQQVADWLAEQPDAPELWAGISTEGAYRAEKQRIVYAGAGHTLLGRWHGAPQDSKATTPVNTQYATDIQQNIREKLAINAVINPLTSFYHCRNGELVSHPEYRQQLQLLAREIQLFFQYIKQPLSFDLLQKSVEVATATANNQSSTLQDILNNRPTELAYINGYLWRQACQLQYKLPETQHLLQQLKEI